MPTSAPAARSLALLAGLTAGLTVATATLAQDAAPATEIAPATEPEYTVTAEEARALLDAVPVRVPELFVGDEAPALDLAGWINGGPIESFEPGRVYVVEFWATWCTPCIAAIPHLRELDETYDDDAVTIISVSTDTNPQDVAARETTLTRFAEANGMTYPVAFEDNAAMSLAWMRPAQQNGIPASFVVDGDGKIAWIGHPLQLDGPLEEVVSGDWDASEARGVMLDEMRARQLFGSIQADLRGGDVAGAARTIDALSLTVHEGDALFGAMMAHGIVTGPAAADGEAVGLAERLARRARAELEASGEQADWRMNHVLAVVLYQAGKDAEAEAAQTAAIDALAEADLEAFGTTAELVQANLAWELINTTSESAVARGVALAEASAEATGWEEAMPIGVLAEGRWAQGDRRAAIETQRRAAAAATDGRMRRQLEAQADAWQRELDADPS